MADGGKLANVPEFGSQGDRGLVAGTAVFELRSRARMTGLIRRTAQLAVVAQVLFVASFLIAATWQGPRYNAMTQSMSDMYAVTAPNALFLVVSFTFCGLATVLFVGLSVWPTLRRAGWPAVAGSALLGLSIVGLGDVLSPFEQLACRIADPGCTYAAQAANAGGALDNNLSFLGIVLFAIAPFFIAEAFRRLPEWKSWAWPARFAGFTFIALFVVDTVAYAMNGPQGLFERLLATSAVAMVGVFAWRISNLRAGATFGRQQPVAEANSVSESLTRNGGAR